MKIKNNINGGRGLWTKLVAVLSVFCIVLVGCGWFGSDNTVIKYEFTEDASNSGKIAKDWITSGMSRASVKQDTDSVFKSAKPLYSESDKFANKVPLRIENQLDEKDTSKNARWLSDCKPIDSIPDNFSFSTSAMLVEDLDPKVKELISKHSTSDKQGFGLYLKYNYGKNESDKSLEKLFYRLNLLDYVSNIEPKQVYSFSIKTLFSRVNFDVNSVPVSGYWEVVDQGKSKVIREQSFGVLTKKVDDKCVGFFVDPGFNVAFYNFEIKGDKTDRQTSIVDERFREAETKIAQLTQQNGELKKALQAEEKARENAVQLINNVLNGDTKTDGLVKQVELIAGETKLIKGEGGKVKITVEGSTDQAETSLSNIYAILRGIESVEGNKTFKDKLDSLYKSKSAN